MRPTPLLILLTLLLLPGMHVRSQAVHLIRFRGPATGDTTIRSAFFVLSSNGSSTVRMKTENGNDPVELELLELFATLPDGQPDTTLLMYEVQSFKKLSPKDKSKPLPVTFWFRQDESGMYRPWAVTDKTTSLPQQANLLSSTAYNTDELSKNKPMVLSWYDTASFFYKNLFVKNTFGGKGTLQPEEAKKTRLFLLVVASTRDSTLMPNAEQDARRMVDFFTDIAEVQLNIPIFVDSVYGSRYNKANVEAALDKLKPGKNDIVVFYYSGHGFRDQKSPAKEFPFLDLRDPNKRPRPEPRLQALNIQDIYSTIIKKGARLNLVLSDCCNDTVEARKPKSTVAPPATRWPIRYAVPNVNTLFLSKTPMNILMTAASKDERAIITPRFSSYFTYFFVESLRSSLGGANGSPSWFQVMENTKKQTTLYASKVPCPGGRNCIQNPRIFQPK